MRREVLEGVEAVAQLVHVQTVEDLHRLAQAEVAGGPRARAREVAREEPLRRPGAEPANRRELRPNTASPSGNSASYLNAPNSALTC